jgi:hypothetical protein
MTRLRTYDDCRIETVVAEDGSETECLVIEETPTHMVLRAMGTGQLFVCQKQTVH